MGSTDWRKRAGGGGGRGGRGEASVLSLREGSLALKWATGVTACSLTTASSAVIGSPFALRTASPSKDSECLMARNSCRRGMP